MDEALAQQLRMQLKPVRGPSPKIEHVRAALLVARDGLPAFKACQVVPGVPADAHDASVSCFLSTRQQEQCIMCHQR